MKKILTCMLAAAVLTACEKGIAVPDDEKQGNVKLEFAISTADVTRGTADIARYFSKLNVMVFDDTGERVFDKVKTQQATDEDFGRMTMQLAEGEYTVVAVGHSSAVSATIKSPEMVQFTAKDGEKLTDTFCYCGRLSVGGQADTHELEMNRASAMFRMVLTDAAVPDAFAKLKFDYTGGSANFNPATFAGTTKSTQSETRKAVGTGIYEVYTFPYMAAKGTLKVTVSAMTESGNVIRQRTFEQVPVTRNRITTYTGKFFEDGDGDMTEEGVGFTVNPEWNGEDKYSF